MKKLILLIIPTILLNLSPHIKETSNNGDVNLNNSITNNLIAKLNGSIELNANITFHYNSYYQNFNIIDQIDASNRVNIININNMTIQESYIKKGNNGEAIESYLSISNTIEERDIVDSNSQKVAFSSMFASPFASFTKLSNEKINSYFDITETDTSFLLKANSLGYGIFSSQLLKFYYDYDSFIWDGSVTRSIKNLILSIDKEGNPLNLTFEKIKKDIFGGIKETYDINICSLSKIKELSPEKPLLSDEQLILFKNKLNDFQNLLDKGNFTQNIAITQKGSTQGYYYSNYYALDVDSERGFPPAMLCNLPLYDASYGETYLGLFETDSGYSTVGISPDKDFSSIIEETESSDIKAVIPNINKISCDFFKYDESNGTYIFDLTNFLYADSYFSGNLLLALFGIADPAVNQLGLYINNYSYSFNSLTLKFDDAGGLSGTLNYNYSGYIIESKFSFTNIGTTNLLDEESISKPVSYYILNGGIDE